MRTGRLLARLLHRGLTVPRHQGTTAHLSSVFPLVAEPGPVIGGPYLGTNVLAGGAAFRFDPFTAYAQANAINHHSLAATNGRTYAELGDDINAKKAALKAAGTSDADIAKDADVLKLSGQRTTIMNGSFLRASLFTSVVAFGIAALVMGLGILFIIVGFALRTLAVKHETVVAPVAPAAVTAQV